jgi:hypothetical protein
VIAGVVYVIPLLPQIPTKIKELIPLLVALGVIGLAQEPEGTVALARRQTLYVLGVLRPLPRRTARERTGAEPEARGRVSSGKVAPGHVQ